MPLFMAGAYYVTESDHSVEPTAAVGVCKCNDKARPGLVSRPPLRAARSGGCWPRAGTPCNMLCPAPASLFALVSARQAPGKVKSAAEDLAAARRAVTAAPKVETEAQPGSPCDAMSEEGMNPGPEHPGPDNPGPDPGPDPDPCPELHLWSA
jgi:hypothetical protein